MKSIYCIVVTFNGIKWVNKCFGSIKSADYPIKTIVVDNGSTDGTQEAIRNLYPEVEIIQSDINLGFGKGNNVGIKRALEDGADYIFLLNQDAYLFKGSFTALLESFDTEASIGIVSPIHLAGDEVNIENGFYRYIRPENTPHLLGDLVLNKCNNLCSTTFVNAAAWVIKSDVIKKIGLFNPVFDHYGEDDEYIYRLQKESFSIFISTQLSVVHDRPQYNNFKVNQKSKKASLRFKQNLLVKYFTGEYTISQVNRTYAKVLFHNLTKFNLKYTIYTIKNWISVIGKINSFQEKDYSLNTCL